MSGKNNVNPDYYKIAGRGRPGEDVVHEREKLLKRARRPRRGVPAGGRRGGGRAAGAGRGSGEEQG